MKVIASAALSADGCLDDNSPERLVLSTPGDWAEIYRLRASSDAILVGAETLRRDDPSLLVKGEELRRERIAAGKCPDLVKATLTRSCDLRPDMKFFTRGEAPRIVFTSCDPPIWLERAAEVIRAPHVSAAFIVTELEKRGIGRLFVEGGAETLHMFFREGLVDTFRLAVNPAVRVDDPSAPRLEWAEACRTAPSTTERIDGMEVTTYHLRPDREREERRQLAEAIELSRRCVPCASCYRVGAVAVTASGERFTGYTHETSATHHAEQEAVAKALAAGADLRGAAMYSSMEPCSCRRSEPESCSDLLVRLGFAGGFALYEPDCFVRCQGALRLREAGIEVRAYPDMGEEVRRINAHIGRNERV